MGQNVFFKATTYVATSINVQFTCYSMFHQLYMGIDEVMLASYIQQNFIPEESYVPEQIALLQQISSLIDTLPCDKGQHPMQSDYSGQE